MPRNKAQNELEKLYATTQPVVNAGEALERLRRGRETFEEQAYPLYDRDGDGKASISMPEAVVTAVGAGWILGPVGGLALGIAQGILGKRAKQNALDAFAAQQDVYGDIDETLNSEFDRLAGTAANPEDLDQLSTLQTQKDVAMRMISSADPQMQQTGAAMLQNVQSGLTSYAQTNETQRINREANDMQLRRDLEQEQYSRYTTAKGNFDNESASYEAVTGATNLVLESLESGSPADLYAAIIGLNKALDPTGVVRPEEAEAYQGFGNLFQSFWAKAEETLGSGQQLLPEQRRDLQKLASRIHKGATSLQLAREARYSDEIFDIGLPMKYHDNFRRVENVPAYRPKPIPDTTNKGEAPLRDQSSTVIGDQVDRTTGAINRYIADPLRNFFRSEQGEDLEVNGP